MFPKLLEHCLDIVDTQIVFVKLLYLLIKKKLVWGPTMFLSQGKELYMVKQNMNKFNPSI